MGADAAAGIRTVGVIGAGQMGSGIAHVCAVHGYDVRLHDLSPERIEAGRQAARARLSRLAAAGDWAGDVEAVLDRIRPAPALAELGAADLVIEAASEREALKLQILQAVGAHLKPMAILSSNTSSISITRLAAATDRPERFIGLHFMNPAPVMRLVEVIRGLATDGGTYEAATAFARSLGKITTESADYPAFLVNRVLAPMINEAIYAVYEGVGSVEAVDTALKLGANHPMGPLELADFIGLDTVAAIMGVLHQQMGDSKYRACPLLVKYVEAGWLGRKTRKGFYDYATNPPTPTR